MKTNIDTFIKQQVSELDGIPPGVERKSKLTWDRIEAELEKEPRRRPMFGWVAAASLGLLATLSFLLMQQNTPQQQLAMGPASSVNNSTESILSGSNQNSSAQSQTPPDLGTSITSENTAGGKDRKVIRGGEWQNAAYYLSEGNQSRPNNGSTIKLDVVGKLGEKVQLNDKWNENATFDFENQFKLGDETISPAQRNIQPNVSPGPDNVINLNKAPLAQKIIVGDESISNTIWESNTPINHPSFNGFVNANQQLSSGSALNLSGSGTTPAMNFTSPTNTNRPVPITGLSNLSVVTGGTPAEYGDLAGGTVSLSGTNSGTYAVSVQEQEILQKIEAGNISLPLNGNKTLENGRKERGKAGWEDPNSVEEYKPVYENAFRAVQQEPLSTFSIDVDRASYANMRRHVTNNQLPHPDVIRIEEMVNYFHYDYKEPKDEHPFNVITEVSDCPWKPEHRLVHIGLQGKKIKTDNLPATNLVFLLDVSGSMDSPYKLGLLKQSFGLLTEQLRKEDRVAIVVYAGAAGVVLNSTPGDQKQTILNALNNLNAGGSTAGGAGINLAYKIAKDNFISGGNNRIVLATDGDFNVGINSESGLEDLIVDKRKDGIFLSVLGFGMGNYKDSKMEILADKGNGNYAYIDGLMEAKKTLVNEFGGTMFAIAKDVKLQIEFNPAKVKGYRLVGYENRVLRNEDFANDKIDAGELGAGHTVTALYEIIPAGSEEDIPGFEPLKYQSQQNWGSSSDEMLTVKLRYKKPDGEKSILLSHAMPDNGGSIFTSSHNFRWSAAVASFGMVLRNSEHQGSSNCDLVLKLARSAQGKDAEGYRAEFISLVQKAKLLKELQNVEVKGE